MLTEEQKIGLKGTALRAEENGYSDNVLEAILTDLAYRRPDEAEEICAFWGTYRDWTKRLVEELESYSKRLRQKRMKLPHWGQSSTKITFTIRIDENGRLY